MKSTYDSCLLHISINQTAFEIVEMQTDDTLMLADDRFADLKENKLVKAKLMFKSREKLTIFISIKFNDEVISRNEKNDSLILNQSKQFD
jgi:hypothetical protein